MITKKKIVKHLQELEKIAIEFLNPKADEDKVFERFMKYVGQKEIVKNVEFIAETYPGFFSYTEKLRIAMSEKYYEILVALIQTKDLELVDSLIAKYYQADIDSKEFTKDKIDNLSEKDFFNWMDKLYFLKDFYSLFDNKEELSKINSLFKDFTSNKNYGRRYALDDYLKENHPDIYALVVSIRSDLKSANTVSIETLQKMKKTAKFNEIKLLEKDIEFLKKNRNHYILFHNELMNESLFRMFCQEYLERTGILEKDITWFNEVLSKGYAVVSMY